jgi:hypothetical protein
MSGCVEDERFRLRLGTEVALYDPEGVSGMPKPTSVASVSSADADAYAPI